MYIPLLQIGDKDKNTLPHMLCYSCIIQLNAAYNFKNTIIETAMYLDRIAIENGPLSMTPAPSSVMDDDQTSVVSSIVPNEGNLMPPPANSLSGDISSPDSSLRVVPGRNTSEHVTVHIPLLDVSQIKTEPLSDLDMGNDMEMEQYVLRTAMAKVIAERPIVREYRKQKKAWPAINLRPSLRSRASLPVRLPTPVKQKSPKKGPGPMVAVHNSLEQNETMDQDFLDRILTRNLRSSTDSTSRGGRPRNSSRAPPNVNNNNNPNEMKRIVGALTYDFKNSKVIREALDNLPAKRLRKRRTST